MDNLMNRLKSVFMAAAMTLFGAGLSWAAEYNIDTDHSKVLFKIRHLGISTVTGRFDKFSGSFAFDPKNVQASKVSATIEAVSVNTDVAKRDEHLRSADFFDVAKFPQITFASKEVRDVQGGKFKVAGDLTIHGVTKPVTLDAELIGTVKDPWGNERAGFSASATINRKDFGLTYNKVLEAGGLLIGEEVWISLEIEGILKK
jgi:polyisoprenoid-binding protein YceI